MSRTFATFGATFLIQLVNLGSGVLVARLLGPEDRGNLAFIVAAYSFIAPVLMLGLNEAAVYQLALRQWDKAEIISSSLMASALTSSLALAACVVFYILAIAPLGGMVAVAGLIFLAYPVLYHLNQLALSFLQVGPRHLIWNLLRAANGPLYLALIGGAWFFGRGNLAAIVSANVIALSVVTLTGLFFSGASLACKRPSAGLSRSLFAYGRTMVVQRLTIVTRDNADKILLPAFVSMTTLGHYSVATAISYLVFLIGYSIDLIAFPALTHRSDPSTRRGLSEATISAGILLSAAAAAVLWPLIDWVLPLLFGASFKPAIPLAKVLLLAGAVQSAKLCIAAVFKANAGGAALSIIEATTVALTVMGFVFIAPIWGALGAAKVILVISAVSAIALLVVAQNRGYARMQSVLLPSPNTLGTLAVNALKRGG
ncbi:lipopolysaccharide biosynthesis protein [Phenylobacterium sp.]|uniref:lipopolysaccharide biosynthesis protein n=1 Tax=Phenylobacterium sp. TaxID=1871053 RepID=UPI002BC22BA5|nr:oligosaccharide flippase family protein [Phenylobacterium sp.]HVI33740.1 oligosaccharide flippase family protein [Phenylobacterium sp.]